MNQPQDAAEPLLARDLASLPDPLPIPTLTRPFIATITPPGSKSLTNRALLLAALADGESTLTGALTAADDAERMIAALRALGAEIEEPKPGSLTVRGVGGRWRAPGGVTLNLNNAGTATRFLAAAAVLGDPASPITIDGNDRMRRRPIGELADLLVALGVRVDYAGAKGFPPLRIAPPADLSALADRVGVGRTASGQFVSALLLVAPFLPRGLTIRFTEPPTSVSYIEMTVGLLRQVGLGVEGDPPAPLGVPRGSLRGFRLSIEPDASGSTYFLAAAAITPGARTTVPGLRDSLQGDAKFADALERMGASVARSPELSLGGPAGLRAIDADLSLMPDAAMTLAAVACFASPTADNPTATTTVRGLRTLRVKETDRIAALGNELAKVGARVEPFSYAGPHGADEGVRVTPPPPARRAAPPSGPFDTYADHRMAMSLALLGLRIPGVSIRDPRCVDKTYPGFWRDWARLYS